MIARAALVLALSAGIARASDLYVAPDGDDQASGAASAPLRTLEAARQRAATFAGREAVTVHVADGVYSFTAPLVFTPADAGTASAPVTYRAVREGGAVLSGGIRITSAWAVVTGSLMQTRLPAGLMPDRLFIEGQLQPMARYPNFNPERMTDAYQGFAADAFAPSRAARWADPSSGFIHAMHAARWGGYHYRITGKKADGSVAYEGGWQNNRQMGMHPTQRMVEHIREELDAPGEWFHDRASGVLYCLPPAGFALATARVEVALLPVLIDVRGTPDQPVRHLAFEGFVIRHTARTFMETREPLLRSDWAIYRGGAIRIAGAEDIAVRDVVFDQPGGNAVFVSGYARRVQVRGCLIDQPGASGICFVGEPKAVRNPLFEYAQQQDLAAIDRTPGPRSPDYPADSAVEDCLIRGVGRVERQAAGVQIAMAQSIAVRDTTIYDCSRAGINIGDGTWGGHCIERVDVFDTVLETHDHGSFNSWGRDRYWASRHRAISEPAVQREPELPFLDAMHTTVIRDSRWRCDHGWDIDLDDGSSHYEIYNNLMLAGGLKFREGYRRHAYNNIMINNGFHPHVWFKDSGDRLDRNILMRGHAPIGMPDGWGAGINRNLFVRESHRRAGAAQGCDAASVSGDPLFEDPASGDFRVRSGSPALAIGFTNFPMNQFGVKKPALKAIARSPRITLPEYGEPDRPAADAPLSEGYWLGARLRGLSGEAYSAFGVSREDGGVHVAEVPEASAAYGAGFRPDDVIQQINGRPVRTIDGLLNALASVTDGDMEVMRVRQQKKHVVRVAPAVRLSVSTHAAAVRIDPLPSKGPVRFSTSAPTANDPVATLGDGQFARGYGPVFPNGAKETFYKVDLGEALSLNAIATWTWNENGNRGAQRYTVYGSDRADDPGWSIGDRARFKPLGSMVTGPVDGSVHVQSRLEAAAGRSLGSFRWLVWAVYPVTPLAEYSAYQELTVEPLP